MRWYQTFIPLCLVAVAAAASCSGDDGATLCEPGSNVFCRCRGGAAGTKACNEAGDAFGPCEGDDGSCSEVPDETTSAGAGGGPPGGNPPPPPGEFLGPCTMDGDCKDGMVCPMGYCTKPCQSYEECGQGVGDCINWEGGAICAPYCIVQENCEPYGLASRCGYTGDSLPPFDIVVCANWGDALELPPDGYPDVECTDDAYCNLGFTGTERVCGPDGCADGCHAAGDCPSEGQTCSSDGSNLGSCSGSQVEDGDDCPGIPLSISLSNDEIEVTGDTSDALPPSEHEVESPCPVSPVESEELVYAVEIGDSGTLIVDLSNSDPFFDPQIYARVLDCASGTQETCADQGLEGDGEIIELDVFQGETIWIFVDGYQGSAGAFTLSMLLSP
jgi:hypothetical protein